MFKSIFEYFKNKYLQKTSLELNRDMNRANNRFGLLVIIMVITVLGIASYLLTHFPPL